MACFLVPAAEAVVVTVAIGVMKAKEKKAKIEIEHSSNEEKKETKRKTSFIKKLGWLAGLLWGGAFLLAFEHIWHGEVVPWFPFLTAAADPESALTMLEEMGTVGVTMAVLVTAVWLGMVAVSHFIEKKSFSRDIKREEA